MQVSEVYNLMKSWESDPCWDLEQDAYDPKYAPYRQILLDFAKDKRQDWAKLHAERKEKKERELQDKKCPFANNAPEFGNNCMVNCCALWDKLGECCCFKNSNGVIKL